MILDFASWSLTSPELFTKTDRKSSTALLLTCLPNLNTILAHVPESDVVLSEVLKQALKSKRQQAFIVSASKSEGSNFPE